jgi:hypothetical protein
MVAVVVGGGVLQRKVGVILENLLKTAQSKTGIRK